VVKFEKILPKELIYENIATNNRLYIKILCHLQKLNNFEKNNNKIQVEIGAENG